MTSRRGYECSPVQSAKRVPNRFACERHWLENFSGQLTYPSSWPGLSRPSTSFLLQGREDVDARQTLVLAIRRRRIALAGH
ncbi:MAG: hypothetical protein ACLP8B_10480, partial [Xanthobacteraceae bacterium]